MDPTPDKNYATMLNSTCKPHDMMSAVDMDPGSSRKFDLHYYKLVSQKKGLFMSDEALLDDSETKAYVQRQAKAKTTEEFFKDFAVSMVNMGKIGVLTHQKSGLDLGMGLDITYTHRFRISIPLTSFVWITEKNHSDRKPTEFIVFEEMTKIIANAPFLTGAFLRMHYHDCFVNGCDASLLLNSTNNILAEKDAPPNLPIRGYDKIDDIKAKLEMACPGIVSCADILAMIARDSVFLTYGPYYAIETGRRDGSRSVANDTLGNLQPPTSNVSTLEGTFRQKGLTAKDLVVLTGAHTIGHSLCSSFSDDRLYNFTGHGGLDPALDPTYVPKLMCECAHTIGHSLCSSFSDDRLYNFTGHGGLDPALDPTYVPKLMCECKPKDNTTRVEMDPGSAFKFDLGYFKGVARRRGLFTSDDTLLHDPNTKAYIERQVFMASPDEFFKDFAESMVKMGRIQVLTHGQGEIRKKCAFVN
ncbi:putative Peroxidase 1 [Cocos nucifera]|nr:putative Peroxidase 1 [Cocos nucifera]